ncbi:MAG: hypothetical protein CME59_02595 [Halioglobus sp.]|nr:hypothetical protein [Halioglobus sp.]
MDQRGEPRPQEASRPAPQRDDHPGDGAASAVLSLALATVRELSHLAGAELRLAADSALRMALLFIAALLLAALAWLALAGLVAALAYQYLGSPVPAIAAFLLCQLLALGAARSAWCRYRRYLSMPHTREQLAALLGMLRQGA